MTSRKKIQKSREALPKALLLIIKDDDLGNMLFHSSIMME
jgi:hypothetical protein